MSRGCDILLKKNPTKEIFMRVDVEENKIVAEGSAKENEPAARSAEEEKNASRLRTAVNFSVIGLILSVFAGAGIVFAVTGIVFGAKCRLEGETASRYAIGLGVAAAVLSFVFGALFAVAFVIAALK